MSTELLTKLDELNKAVADRKSESFAAHVAVQEAQQALSDFLEANNEGLQAWRRVLGAPDLKRKRAVRSDKNKPRGPRKVKGEGEQVA